MRKLLIVVDMQNDFVDGALGTKEAEAIVQNVKEKILSYPEKDVVVTLDTHEENYLDTRQIPTGSTLHQRNRWLETQS